MLKLLLIIVYIANIIKIVMTKYQDQLVSLGMQANQMKLFILNFLYTTEQYYKNKNIFPNYKYILVLKDDFTNFVMLTPTSDMKAITVADVLLHWLSLFGIPVGFCSDQGSHFVNTIIQTICISLKIKHHFHIAYNSQSNGTVEVVNKHILFLMRTLLSETKLKHTEWNKLIPFITHNLNNTKNKINIAPVESFTGHSTTNALDILIEMKTINIIQSN